MTTLNADRVRAALKGFEFPRLFTEELGWDRHSSRLEIPLDGRTWTLRAFAEKRGVQIFQCDPDAEGNVPDYNTRRKIEKQVAHSAYEHLIIFVDGEQSTQIWQWVARSPGEPAAFREHAFHPAGQSGDALIQKLERISIPLDEDEALDLTGTVHRLKDAFDRDKVTKKFYDRFKKEHGDFLKFVKGITQQGDREWYASLMLNRLMFVYFIQKKGFLDGDLDYLRNRMRAIQARRGKGRFLSFYRCFLLALFHEGLAKQPRHRELDDELNELLGDVPYLNGGLFEVHSLEEIYTDVDLPDEAFEKLFDFFDQYDWHLDVRPLRNDNEINPDVLGYIFEKYINQKQMGAYYTREDVTDYISRNTIIPFLFDAAKKKCAVAFQPGSALWRLLQDDPDRYIFAAVRRGVVDDRGDVIPLPDEIAAGVDDVAARDGWNRAAAADYALPTESWREHVARRTRCLELREKMRAGEIEEINDLITYNLDVRQFAQDAVSTCEGPEFLRAFWQAIRGATVLDPTCGSGAFLFAALNILEPLYAACLDRMQGFVDDLALSGESHSPKKFEDFRRVLAEIDRHPNRDYFILKSIVVGNLYGVDIMDEAVEICKLRLFLKLVAQVNRACDLEPLPDVDFNIRPGNTLVGYTSLEEIRTAVASDRAGQRKFEFSETEEQVQRIEEDAEIVDRTFQRFHEMQTAYDMDAREFTAQKQELRQRLNALSDELDRYLAGEYGVNADDAEAYDEWRSSHQPFHWSAEFYGIMTNGGFDVVIGNPPYVRTGTVRRDYEILRYQTQKCPDAYAWVLERASLVIGPNGTTGMIVPLSITFSAQFAACRQILFTTYDRNWFSSYGRIPSALFSFDVRVRNTIHLGFRSSPTPGSHATRLHRWFDQERPNLLALLQYAPFTPKLWNGRIPKVDSPRLLGAMESYIASQNLRLNDVMGGRTTPAGTLYFKKTAYNWLAFSHDPPPCFDENGAPVPQSQIDTLQIDDVETLNQTFLLLNGKLAFLYWYMTGDDFHVTKGMLGGIPAPFDRLSQPERERLTRIGGQLHDAMRDAVTFKLNAGKKVGSYNLARCRAVTDQSDRIFARACGFDDAYDDLERLYAKAVRTDFHDD